MQNKVQKKTGLLLIELTLMLLFFALSSVVCLSIFASAQALSKQALELDCAAVEAQNAAECFKAAHGDIKRTAALLCAEPLERGFALYFDEHWQDIDAPAQAVYVLRLEKVETEAKISVYRQNALIFEQVAGAANDAG